MTGLTVLLAAAALTGQSADCEHFCMSVRPAEAPEGSVFTFRGRHWAPNRRVRVSFGAYCRLGEACPDILYLGTVKATARGRFVFRLRAGAEQDGDQEAGIRSGGTPTFKQRARIGGRPRTVSRTPRYRVILPN
ncbi:MAG TPA: hypothetical protein VJT68_00610 [Thermoleophilaceae bacterium]|nr:hypothetical protein [Thermoleophilaceae bacterium]